MLVEADTDNINEVLYHLRRSFTMGDSRHDAQFLYARALYLNDQINDAKIIFEELSKIPIAPHIKKQPRGTIKKGGKKQKFSGIVKRIELSYGFIIRDIIGDGIFFDSSKSNNEFYFSREDKVSFHIAFTYRGPIAVDIKKI